MSTSLNRLRRLRRARRFLAAVSRLGHRPDARSILYPVLHFFMTFFFFFFAAPARRIVLAHLAIILPGSSRAMNYLRAFRTLS